MAYEPGGDEIARHAEELADSRYEFLEQLVACRRRRGLSQTEVGQRMDVSQPTISALERYDANPTLATLERYALAIGAHLTLEVKVPNDRWSHAQTTRTQVQPQRVTRLDPTTVPAWDFAGAGRSR